MIPGFDAKLTIGPVNYTPPRFLTSPVLPANALRNFQGIPCIAKTASHMWVAFYGDDGTGERPGNFGIVKRADMSDLNAWSTEGYVTWPGDGTKRAFDPRLWTDPNGHLWQFWTASGNSLDKDGKLGVWCSVCENPDDASPVWSRFFMISPIGCPTRPFMLNGVPHIGIDYWYGSSITTAVGKHVYELDYENRRLGQFLSTVPSAGSSEDTYDETSRAALPSGTVVCAVRNKVDGLSWSKSTDGMETWSAPVDWSSAGAAPASRAAVAVTAGGRLALAYNNASDRRNMTLKLSDDDGATWPYSIVLDSRLNTSYPDIEIDGDDIYVVFDFERTGAKRIYVAKVSETDLVAGTASPTIYVADDA